MYGSNLVHAHGACRAGPAIINLFPDSPLATFGLRSQVARCTWATRKHTECAPFLPSHHCPATRHCDEIKRKRPNIKAFTRSHLSQCALPVQLNVHFYSVTRFKNTWLRYCCAGVLCTHVERPRAFFLTAGVMRWLSQRRRKHCGARVGEGTSWLQEVLTVGGPLLKKEKEGTDGDARTFPSN